MTKLYISYYGDSISIVEGSYNKKKIVINDTLFMKSSDIDSDYSEKYSLLKEALKSKKYNAKKVILCLNTFDVIVKSNKISKVAANDLHGIMSMEIDEMMCLERDRYIFSYEVTKEVEENGEKFLDLVLAGIDKYELDNILKIFEEFNLKLEYIDILATAYSRVLKEVEYTDMMIVNTGEYSTSIDIYKEDSLYIHDSFPVRLGSGIYDSEYTRLVDESKGLMNYYSSRNFGKTVDSILLIGNYAKNKEIIDRFKEVFRSEIISGIENLYYIYDDIKGDISESNLNKIVEIIGCMMREEKKNSYSKMNLLPEEMKKRNEKNAKVIKYIKIAPIVLLLLHLPVITLGIMNDMKEKELNLLQAQIEEKKLEYGKLEDIEKDIEKKEEEIKIYDMLMKKEPKWGPILNSIDMSIPFKIQLDSLDLSYQAEVSEDEKEAKKEAEKEEEKPGYDKIPNFIAITGKSSTPSLVGQFLYNIKALPYFEDIKLSGVSEQSSGTENNKKHYYTFTITAKIKKGVVTNE